MDRFLDSPSSVQGLIVRRGDVHPYRMGICMRYHCFRHNSHGLNHLLDLGEDEAILANNAGGFCKNALDLGAL